MASTSPINNHTMIIKCQSVCRRWLTNHNKGVTSSNLLNLNCHKNFITPKSQYDYYLENNASEQILKYVSLQGKTFGEKYMEPLAAEWFSLDARTDSGHDHNKLNRRLEQKSARYHANGNDWKWQHIEMNHQWEYLLLCGLDFKEIKFYIGSRTIGDRLIDDKIIEGQGKRGSPQQGYWFTRCIFKTKNKDFNNYFKEVKNEKQLIRYLNLN